MALRAIVLITCLALVQAELINLSCQHIRAFVDGHNQRRQQVARGELPGQPPAQDMSYMVWDEELAAKAAAWAERNIYDHNPDRGTQSGRWAVGENMDIKQAFDYKASTDTIPEDSIRKWFDEHRQYTFGPFKASDVVPGGPMVAHYTQIVWANTAYVGCAISQKREYTVIKYIIVCNYGPSGNVLGQTPYVPGGGPNTQLTCAGDCQRPYGKQCSRRWPFLFLF